MTTDLEVYEAPQPPATLFGTDDPGAVVAAATAAAKPLAEVVDRQRLYATISGRKHVRVEGWSLLGSMLGVFPVTVWTRKLDNGWEARVEARTKNGEIVGAAEAQCDRSERMWANRDEYALRSMAQTRATSKALRQPLGFVMTLAGFDATPAEEMPREAAHQPDIIEAAEIILAPDGDVFPDQREPEPSQFKPPASSDRTPGQQKMVARLRKKLVEQMGQPAEAIDNEIAKAQGKSDTIRLIDRLKKLAGEES